MFESSADMNLFFNQSLVNDPSIEYVSDSTAIIAGRWIVDMNDYEVVECTADPMPGFDEMVCQCANPFGSEQVQLTYYWNDGSEFALVLFNIEHFLATPGMQ